MRFIPNTPTPRVRSALTLLLAVALVATACGGGGRPELATPVAEAPTTSMVSGVDTNTATPNTATPDTATPDTATSTSVAEPAGAESGPTQRAISIVDTLVAFDAPGSDVALVALERSTDFGSARVLLVEEVAGDWVRVQLPIRPNETSGWVRAAEVQLESVDYAVHVDLERRVLQVLHQGTLVMQAEVAVGSNDNPTPLGTFFVTDKVSTPDPNGAYGPFALGLSGHSETLTEFGGGDGQIGIHGTNDPSSIGQKVSHGCVRLPNELIAELAALLPLGTPVTVQ